MAMDARYAKRLANVRELNALSQFTYSACVLYTLYNNIHPKKAK